MTQVIQFRTRERPKAALTQHRRGIVIPLRGKRRKKGRSLFLSWSPALILFSGSVFIALQSLLGLTSLALLVGGVISLVRL